MKSIKFFLFIFILAVGIVNAQTYTTQSGTDALDAFNSKTSQLGFLSSQTQQNYFNNAATASNNVFIRQVGDGNNASVSSRTADGDINVLQNGSDNDLYVDISAETIKQTIVQNGDNNSIYHTNPFRLQSHESQILQNGNNQNLEWFGENSLSEKMKISMQGENQSVIVRSFN